jgi:hypothetical protein
MAFLYSSGQVKGNTNMKLIEIPGTVGALMLFVKIVIHVFIKLKVEKKFSIGPGGNMLNPILFLPIFDDVVGYLKVLKKIGNLMYVFSLILIVISLIGINIH